MILIGRVASNIREVRDESCMWRRVALDVTGQCNVSRTVAQCSRPARRVVATRSRPDRTHRLVACDSASYFAFASHSRILHLAILLNSPVYHYCLV